MLMKGRKDIRLQYEPKDIFLEADKARLQRVISNLLNNAIKFTTKGNITISSNEAKSEQRSTKVQVSIIDTGSGLSDAILPKLFSKFVSTDCGGTGLGLFVSKNIIESHGGRLEAQNNPNWKGATFSFIIPDKLC
jgi:signal transduction histidine kinase